MDFEQARSNMIDKQIRPWDVWDLNTLDLLAEIHREDFVPEAYKNLALSDTNIPLLHGQLTMTPKLEARLLQSVMVKRNESVLEIGTGCGYLTALLAKIAGNIHSIDIFPEFAELLKPKLKNLGVTNVKLHSGDGIRGWQQESPYDVIIVTGSVPQMDENFHQQLKKNGRLFIITGETPVMEAKLITKINDQDWTEETLFETDLPALIGATKENNFNF